MLTPEEIDLLKRLQPKIREAMGTIRKKDSLIYNGLQCFVSEDVHPSYFRLEFDAYVAVDHHEKCFVGSAALRLPLPIDPVNPERGLWGMVEGNHKHLTEGNLSFWQFHVVTRYSINGWPKTFQGGTPTLTLLLALAAQEGA
jgi:hypothetical protein